MAILYTDIAAPQKGGTNVLADLNNPNLDNGRIQLITAVYTMVGTEAANDIIYIARVPQGVVVDPTSSIASNGIAAAATVTIGDTDTKVATVTADASRYSGAIDPHAASTTPVQFASGTTLAVPSEIVDDWVWLTATFATMTTPVAGKVLVFRIRLSGLD